MDLRANAIITAVDRFSGPVRAMGAALNAMTGRANVAATRFANMGNALTLGLAAAPAALGGLSMVSQYHLDKIRTGLRSIGGLTGSELDDLNTSAASAALKYGHNLQTMLQGAKDLVQGGLASETLAAGMDILGQAARRNQEPVGQMAEKLIQTSRALGYSLDSKEDVQKSFMRSADLLSVAPNISTDSMQGFFTFLKYYGPIARVMGQKEDVISAVGATMADLGFKGEEGGAAMRTILARMVTMTPKGRAAFRAEGGQLEELFKLDNAKLSDMRSLQERLRGVFGSEVGGLEQFGDVSRFRDVSDWRDALNAHLTTSLGIGKGQAQDRKTLTAMLEQHISRAITEVDIERMFGHLAALETSLATDSELFGKQRLQQGVGLKNALPLFRRKLEEARRQLPGATGRGDLFTLGTLSTELDRFTAAWSVFKDKVFGAGPDSIVTAAFRKLADGLGALSAADPNRLNQLALGIGALVALPAGALAISAVAAGFTAMAGGLTAIGAAFAGAPILTKLLMGGGLLALMDLPSIFTAPDDLKALPDAFGTYPKDFSQMPIAITLREVANLFGELGGIASDAYASIRGIFGADVSNMPLLDAVQQLNVVLAGAAAEAKALRSGGVLPFIAGKEPDKPQDWGWAGRAWDWGRSLFGSGGDAPMSRPAAPPQQVDVQGEARVKVDVEIHGLPAGATATTPQPREAAVPLNSGRGMSDIRRGPR
jgi:hypothetical protein